MSAPASYAVLKVRQAIHGPSLALDRFHAPATLVAILEDVAHLFDIPVKDLASRDRQRHLAHARFAYAWVAREVIGASYSRIGKPINVADQTSVLHQVRRGKQLRKEDEEFKRLSDRVLSAARSRSEVQAARFAQLLASELQSDREGQRHDA
jgi:chromosomal replication initiation ATPase DnaA